MKNFIIILFLQFLLFSSCGEDIAKSLSDDQAPDQVEITKIENGVGKARVYYKLPKSESLLYIEASYEDNGKTIVAKGSAYTNYLDLEGFSTAKNYHVDVYAVSRGLNKSAPTAITVSPEKPGYLYAFDNMQFEVDFGGFNLNLDNPTQSSLAIFVEKFNAETNDWDVVDDFYTQEKSQILTIRNQSGMDLQFRFRIRDKFQNYSEFKTFTVSPYVESEMDYSQFSGLYLANDPPLFPIGSGPQPHSFMWNQNYNGNPSTAGGWVGTTNTGSYSEHTITFDLGKETKVTRLVTYQRGIYDNTSLVWTNANLSEFELYGSNNPSADGAWSSWDLIMTCTITKPAGSAADLLEIAKRGHEFSFDRNVPKYRYLRIKQKRTFTTAGNSRFFLAGIRLFENQNF